MKSVKLIHPLLILIAIAGTLFSQYFTGYGSEFLSNYGANFFFPFGIYFIVRYFPVERYIAALIAFGGVFLQELGQWFGMYAGVFDFPDLIADLSGVMIALVLDRIIHRTVESKVKPEQ
jgi:glycopeptide antibiotics resistance protein